MEFSLKQVFKKNWLAIVTACITAGILIYFLVTTDGINAFRAVANSLDRFVIWSGNCKLGIRRTKPALHYEADLSGVEVLELHCNRYGGIAVRCADAVFLRWSAHAGLLHEEDGDGCR